MEKPELSELVSQITDSKDDIYHYEKPDLSELVAMIDDSDEDIKHYGTPRHSGRYPWGSGDNPYQRNAAFLAQYRDLHDKGMSDSEIAKGMGISTTELRAKRSIASAEEKQALVSRARKLKEKGLNNTQIALEMGMPASAESTVRNWLKSDVEKNAQKLDNTAAILKRQVAEKGAIDIGTGVELEMGVTKDNLATAAAMLKEKGYEIINVKIPQANNPDQYTTTQVLAAPGTKWADLYYNPDKIKPITEYSGDGGLTFRKVEFPESVDPKRVFVRYAEDGGLEKDGTIEIRRGVDDLSLGNVNYAQVRIAVDDPKGKKGDLLYAKGMAFYSDNIPEGYDMVVNSNKESGTSIDKVLKKVGVKDPKTGEYKIDPETGNRVIDRDNPFGATIKDGGHGQTFFDDPNGKFIDPETGKRQSMSCVNKIKGEGDWEDYSKNLASQFLSKQSKQLIDKQLNLTYANKKEEFEEIKALENEAIKKRLLDSFADDCDSATVHLKAASLPGQSSKVILPVNTLKDTEVYAPTYKDGTKVCLIRYPHAGTFEIPELTVNNKNKEGNTVIGKTTIDAIGINKNVADKLSGADFDGDSVVVIPVNDRVHIRSSETLKGLKGFDDKAEYPYYEGMRVMTSREKGIEMGKISNLITDMTLQGATNDEMERAVKHSMVVIDAEKHKLNFRQSEKDNNIAELRAKYQPGGGASTLISRAGADLRGVPEIKKKGYKPNAETGEWEYEYTNRTYTKKDKKTGELTEHIAPEKSMKRMDYAFATGGDATDLIGVNHPKEVSYANYANKVKALANEARKESMAVKTQPINKEAKEKYADEVKYLDEQLETALKNAPRERQAQAYAASMVRQAKKNDPNLSNEELRKVGSKALAVGRSRYGAGKKSVYVKITPRAWEAIQAGAISTTKLSKILNNTDLDVIKELATPRNYKNTITDAKISKMKSMKASGFTLAEIAESLGVSSSTVSSYL